MPFHAGAILRLYSVYDIWEAIGQNFSWVISTLRIFARFDPFRRARYLPGFRPSPGHKPRPIFRHRAIVRWSPFLSYRRREWREFPANKGQSGVGRLGLG